MTWYKALILALIVGLSEVLPVSGSGTRILLEKLMGFHTQTADLLLFRAAVHFGTVIAFFVFYFRPVLAMLKELLVLLGISRPTKGRRGVPLERRQLMLCIFALLPLLLALPLRGIVSSIENGPNTLLIVGLLFGLSGLLLFFTDRGWRKRKTTEDLTLPNALGIGLAQTASVFPGLSRGGATLSAAMAQGFDRSCGIEFSGFLAIPAFLAAAIVEVVSAHAAGAVTLPIWYFLIGAGVSAGFGWLGLRFWTSAAKRHRSTGFAFWCWGSGIFSIVIFLISA